MINYPILLQTSFARDRRIANTAFAYPPSPSSPRFVAGGQHPRIAVALVVLACFSFAVGLYPSIASAFRAWRTRKKAGEIAYRAFPELRKFVRRFEDFVDGRKNNTLHYIAQSDLCQGNGATYNKLGLPDMAIWSGFRNFFCARIEREEPTILALRQAIEEFHHLVGSYNNQCAAVVFEPLPQDLHAGMNPKIRSSLNSLQQRLSGFLFLSDYQDFAKDLAESTPALSDVARNCESGRLRLHTPPASDQTHSHKADAQE